MRTRKVRPGSAALVLGACGALVLSACGGGGSSFGGAAKTQATGPAKLSIMIGSSGAAETNAVEAAAAAWSKKSGNTAKVIVASDLGQQLGQGFAGGTPPDLFYADASRIGDFAKVGNLYAYGDQVKSASFLPSLVTTFTYKDKLQCAPKDYSTLALVINTDLWAAAGLTDADIPKDWAGLETVAKGDVEFRRGRLVIRADRLAYDAPQDLATAKGQVRVVRDNAIYSGSELSLRVQRFEGYFMLPEFEFPRLGAGGRADRLEFLGDARSRALNAEYTSCPRDGPQEPAWVLTARSVSLDLDINEGVAEGALLRFLGLPILALPTLSFPLGDQRRSGWLPPSVNFDNRGGLELGVPYYWDIAPNRDATFAPRIITRRGIALDGEFHHGCDTACCRYEFEIASYFFAGAIKNCSAGIALLTTA